MKKIHLISSVLFLFFLLEESISFAQCVKLNCPPNITIPALPGTCEAPISYTPPVGTDTCIFFYTDTFNFTGSVQTFIVPQGVDTITAKVYGAQGGANWINNTNYGGFVQADIPVTPGNTLYLYVGEKPTGLTGGWNGGGNGETGGKGGGGASDIRKGGTSLNDRVIVAGGAGGAGYWSGLHVVGGYGGGLSGGPGYRDNPGTPGGDPGSQVSSGNGTCISLNNPVCAGGFGYGGAPSSCGCEGYGGGGGWWGGAGSGNCRGGGGGSGYVLPGLQNVTMSNGVQIGHGKIILLYKGNPTVTTSLVSGLGTGANFPVGTTTETYKAVSQNGDSIFCSFTITVTDNEKPTFTICPNDTTVCEGSFNFNFPAANDNCPGATVSQISGPSSGTSLTAGTYTIKLKASDLANNSDTCEYNVTVEVCAGAITHQNENFSIKVYPNPMQQNLNIETKGIEGSFSITFINSIGAVVKQITTNQSSLQIEKDQMPSGLYHFTIKQKTTTLLSGKIVVE